MDLLSIITGIGMTVFLLFYLAFSLDKDHWALKVLTVGVGVFILILIPQATIEADKDCSILSDGSYKCFYSNGTAVTDFEGGSDVGISFMNSYTNYLVFFGIYLFVFLFYRVFVHFKDVRSKKNDL